jgi:hypothetical protein
MSVGNEFQIIDNGHHQEKCFLATFQMKSSPDDYF